MLTGKKPEGNISGIGNRSSGVWKKRVVENKVRCG